jgi:hypothetical protein
MNREFFDGLAREDERKVLPVPEILDQVVVIGAARLR